MDRIASFSVDHDLIEPGIYISRIDGDIVTYDLRTRKPNAGDYMDNLTMHTVEHMLATFLRNSEIGGEVIYFGPMGCRTGFYLLVRDTVTSSEVIGLLQKTMDFIAGYEGEIPGVSPAECGNYREHSLPKAKEYAADMAKVLKDWTPEKMKYEV